MYNPQAYQNWKEGLKNIKIIKIEGHYYYYKQIGQLIRQLKKMEVI